MNKISILINNYNYGDYIAEAIDSALNQTAPGIEVIVVDDGSTDDSPKIMSAYGDRIRSIYQKNCGQTAAMNIAYAESVGDVIFFLDADDLLDLDIAKRVSELFDEDPSAVVIQWQMAEIDRQGRTTGQMMPRVEPAQGDLRQRVLRDGPNSFRRSPTSGNAWRRQYLDKVMPMPEYEKLHGLGSASMDAYLSCIATLYGTVRVLEGPLGAYRVHGANAYAAADFDWRLERTLMFHNYRCQGLIEHCDRLGIMYDRRGWESGWAHRVKIAMQELAPVFTTGDPFILIDEAEWGMSPTAERRVFPFIEKDGQYWGKPESDRHAIDELNRLLDLGVHYVVVAWPGFWWLDYYKEFSKELGKKFDLEFESDRIKTFKLKK